MGDDVKTIEPFVGPVAQPDQPFDVKVRGTVSTRDDEERSFSTGSTTMSTAVESVPVLPRDPSRRAGVLSNPSTVDTVYVMGNRSDSAGNGFPLLPGASLAINHQAPVYALCPTATAANQVTLYFAIERAA
jgi:hypothetical protein